MKVHIHQKDLLIFAKRIQNIVEINSIKNSPNNVFTIVANAEKNEIVMKSFCPIMEVTYKINGPIFESGSVVLNSKTFIEFIKEMPRIPLILHKKEDIISITSDNISCSIPVQSNNDEVNPFENNIDEDAKIRIEIKNLKELLKLTSYIASRDTAREILQGIMIQLKEDAVEFTTSDGKRLARYYSEAEVLANRKSSNHQYIVPIKLMEEIERYISSQENGSAMIIFNEQFAKFIISQEDESGDEMMFCTNFMQGKYPNISSILPAEKDIITIYNIDCNSLSEAIKVSSAFTSEKFSSIKFNITSSCIKLTGNSPEKGEGVAKIDLSDINIENDITIGFNYSLILSIIKKFNSSKLNIKIKNPYSPCIINESITSTQRPVSGFTILMPMKLLDK